MSIFEVFRAGGIVSVPLLMLSVLTLAAIVERAIFWGRLKRRQNCEIRDLLRLYPHDIPEAIARLQRHGNLPTARIFLDAIAVPHPSPEALRLALESATHKELPLLRRFNTAFDVAIGAAPLLGLLGTILGLIRSFASLKLGEMGGSGAVEVTGGISEALISTAIGLVVAVVALVSANIFRGFYRRYLSAIQSCGNQLELLCLYQQAGVLSPAASPMGSQGEAAIAAPTTP